MAELLWGNYMTGAVVVSDSKDILKLITDLAQGLNGSIAYTFESYERILVVEFRSLSALTTVRGQIKSNNGSLSYDGNTYLVLSMSMSELFDTDPGVWTYNIALYRD